MACDITKGRKKACKDSIGGIVAAFFINFLIDPFTVVDAEVTDINDLITEVFQYELRGDNNSFVESYVTDRNTGTSVNTQTLTLELQKLGKETSNEVKLMAHGFPIVVVKNRNGDYQVAGLTDGLDLTGSNIGSGAAKTDFNGYNLTFTGVEKDLAPFLDAATITELLTLVSATVIEP